MNMRDRSLISVIVPVFNAELYLHQCIHSILNQTYELLEIILVDDGSTDHSGKICDDFKTLDSRVVVVHKANEGLMKARKTGMEHAKGIYVTFVDADDWIDQNTYSSMMEDGNDCDIIACGIYRYYSLHDVKKELPAYRDGVYDRKNILDKMVPDMLWKKEKNDWNLDPSLCTKLFKREILLKEFDRADYLNCYFGEDTVIIFPLMLRINAIKVLSRCYYYHRQRKEGEVPPYIQNDDFFDLTYQAYQYLKQEFINLGYWDIMKNQLEHFYLNALERKRLCYQETTGKMYPVFPFEEVPKGASVILYGAGKVGRKYMEQNEKNHFCNIIMWADRAYQTMSVPGYRIESPEKMKDVSYDYIVIAIDIREAAAGVIESLKEDGVPKERIIWHSIRKSSF